MNRFVLCCLGALLAALALAQIQKAPTYSISGSATQSTLLYLTGPTQVRPASVTGKPPMYHFTGLAPGAYTVRPSKSNCTFQPAERSVTITNSNVTGVDFDATCTPPQGQPQDPKGPKKMQGPLK
jgi:hypothetical protein